MTATDLPAWLTKLDSCPSSNTWLNQHAREHDHGDVIWAIEQTAGRGQRSNVWVSSAGSLTFSILVEVPTKALSYIGLVSGLAACHAIDDLFSQQGCDQRCMLKWPNDVYVQNRKVGGILCESLDSTNTTNTQMIVGIGINHRNTFQAHELAKLDTATRQPISLCAMMSDSGEGLDLISAIRRYLLEGIAMLSLDQWNSLRQQIQDRDWLLHREIRIDHQGDTITGTALGIHASGQLLLADQDGIKHTFYTGHITVLADSKETP